MNDALDKSGQDADGNTIGGEAAVSHVSRRSFLGGTIAAAAMGASGSIATRSEGEATAPAGAVSASSTFIELLRVPDRVTVYLGLKQSTVLAKSGSAWSGGSGGTTFKVTTEVLGRSLSIRLAATSAPVSHVHVRWSAAVSPKLLALGDQWERSYGDLGWRNMIPERVMPWYFATYEGGGGDSAACHAYGVKTGAGAMCFWQLDPRGASLWLDVQNGGSGVQLGDRELHAATVVTRRGARGEDAFHAVQAFCKQMCSRPALPMATVYGTNDWYYAYGNNQAAQIVRDTELIASLTTGNVVRPFSVIDMGWDVGAPAFPDMAKLARDIRALDVRPGIWVRPLKAPVGTPTAVLLPAAKFGQLRERNEDLTYDPTLPEGQEFVRGRIQQLVDRGFDLIKHDFSTYDLLGRWGFEMGPGPTLPGWSFHDKSKTNAEIIRGLYELIRKTAGAKTVIVGCNTVGHQSQGLFDISRTGDDTSGRVWERTRRMGVNTLAYRLPQHGAFFTLDADCVGITSFIPWQENKQWLDLVARSGTALFVSPEPQAIGDEQKSALREAFAMAASGGLSVRPADWFHESTPEEWIYTSRGVKKRVKYDWLTPDGAFPFTI